MRFGEETSELTVTLSHFQTSFQYNTTLCCSFIPLAVSSSKLLGGWELRDWVQGPSAVFCLLFSLVPRLQRSGTWTLKLCRCGEPGIFSHVRNAKDREEVESKCCLSVLVLFWLRYAYVVKIPGSPRDIYSRSGRAWERGYLLFIQRAVNCLVGTWKPVCVVYSTCWWNPFLLDTCSHLLRRQGKVSQAVDDLYGTAKFSREWHPHNSCIRAGKKTCWLHAQPNNGC